MLALLPKNAATLLDVACGTGEHHRYLKASVQVTGLDLNDGLLAMAEAKNSGLRYHRGDMRDFQLRKTFDVVTCLFSSIGYCLDLDSVAAALRCMGAHLAPHGLLVVEPWLPPESWQEDRIFSQSFRNDDLHLCRMSRSRREGRLSIVDFHYLVGRPEHGVRSFRETHTMGLHTREEMTQAFSQADLQVEYDEHGLCGRGLYLASLPLEASKKTLADPDRDR